MRQRHAMKLSIVDRIPSRSSTTRFRLTVLALVLSGTVALSETKQKPKPSATPKPTLTPNPTGTPGSAATPKPAPTPETQIDAKTEAELLLAEDRFIVAIRNGDAKALGELLHDHFADSFGRYASVATTKRGLLDRVGGGQVPAYPVIKDRHLSVSVDLFTVEGLAHAERQEPGDEPWDDWFRVRRLWTKTEGRWVITAQMITPLDKDAKEKEKD